MSIISASKICLLAPLASVLVACSVDVEPEQTGDPRGVVETAESATPERTGTATGALSSPCCMWIYDWYQCFETDRCPIGPTPVPTREALTTR